MVNVWKIGSWPGLWGYNSLKHKDRFISEYALPKGFIALGYCWVPNLKNISGKGIRDRLEKEGNGKVDRRTKELLDFARSINVGDIILLYNHYKVFVGVVKKRQNGTPYYFIEKGSKEDFIGDTKEGNIAPHRIDVDWRFSQRFFDADFSKWQDSVHKVNNDDLKNVKDNKLRKFLESRMSV